MSSFDFGRTAVAYNMLIYTQRYINDVEIWKRGDRNKSFSFDSTTNNCPLQDKFFFFAIAGSGFDQLFIFELSDVYVFITKFSFNGRRR